MSERFAPVSTMSLNGPRPLIMTGATMRPIWSSVVGVANCGPDSSSILEGGSTGASAVTVGGTSLAVGETSVADAVAGTSVAGVRSALHNPESAQAVTTKRFMRAV